MSESEKYKISMAAARVNVGMTQAEIAKKMSVSKQTIVNWENGKVIPKPAQMKMFCDLCQAPIDSIILPRI